jgi:CBS-domain-containing membrane protein
MRISDLMCGDVKCCFAGQSLADAAQIMWEYDLGCVPVVEEGGKVVGMVTDRDICMATFLNDRAPDALLVQNVMTKDVLVCSPESDLWAVQSMMQRSQVRRIPVTDREGKLVGIISLNDFVQEAEREQRARYPEVTLTDVARTLGAVCRPRRSFEHATI